ncbi:MAG: cytochrome P460 family protein [Verrucomicrobiales bacterium]
MKIVSISFLSCAMGVMAVAGDAPKAEAVLKSYQTDFVKMTEKPHRVNAGIFMHCRRVPAANLEEMLKEDFGPHFLTNIDIFVDEKGAVELKKETKVLPVGTVIVKKKTKTEYFTSRLVSVEGVDGVGGMIKREAGYDPENGNWEYFYSDEDGNVTSGKMENCIKCHQKAAETDYVFGTWLKPILKKEAGETKKQ